MISSILAASIAATTNGWPFAMLRSYGSYERNRVFTSRAFAAQERHPGLIGEIWFCDDGTDPFMDPDLMGAKVLASCGGGDAFATDGWYNRDDHGLPKFAFNAIPVTVAEAEPDVLIATSTRRSGLECFPEFGACDYVAAGILPRAADVVPYSVMTADTNMCGTCVIPTEFGGKAVVVQKIWSDWDWAHTVWAGCRRRGVLNALDEAVPGLRCRLDCARRSNCRRST